VAITDRASVLECARRNARMNRKLLRVTAGSATVQPLSWCGKESVDGLVPADVIIGSDLVYDEAAFEPLVCVLRQLR